MFLQPGSILFIGQSEIENRFQISGFRSAIVSLSGHLDGLDMAFLGQLVDGIGQLDFAAVSGWQTADRIENFRLQDIAPD